MEVVNTIKEVLSEFSNVKFAYLFGSYASGKQSRSSDIDVAVYFDDIGDIFDAKLALHHKLEIDLNKEIDLICLNEVKSIYLLKEILNSNILLKESADESRMIYEVYKHHEIIDFLEFKKIKDVA